MKQTSNVTKALTAAQEIDAALKVSLSGSSVVVYRLYTEDKPNLCDLTERYFKGANFTSTFGLWEGKTEQGAVIEIIGTTADLQSVVHLAGDIKHINAQQSVLVTWQNASLINV